MKTLLLVLLVTLQAPINSPGAEIVNVSWRGPMYSQVDDRAPFSIDVKNTGAKPITAVDWEILLVDTVRGNSVIDRLRFRTDDKKIEPGKKKRLTKRIDFYPISDNVSVRALITRLEYADGSYWASKPAN